MKASKPYSKTEDGTS